MKTKIFLSITIGVLMATSSIIAQTFYYNKTKTFVENGYTYQCDNIPNSGSAVLYNKNNIYTYEDMYYKDGSGVYRFNGKNSTMQKDNWTKLKCNSVINNAFTPEQKKRVKGYLLSVTLIINPQTGKVIEVSFRLNDNNPLATIPISVYRQMEINFKNEVWFTPTEEGKKINYIMRGWVHEIE